MLGGKRVLYERFYSVCAHIAQGPILRSRPYCAGARIAKEPILRVLPYSAGAPNPVLRALRSDVSAAMLRHHPLRVHFLDECTAETC